MIYNTKTDITSESFSEKEKNSEDWNVVCYGVMLIDRETSTAIINPI